jgi:uncharacterized protein (DUF1697 family)
MPVHIALLRARLERLLEDSAWERLGLTTDIFVRSAKEWQSIIAGNPFPREAKRDPSHLLVEVLEEAPDRIAARALQQAITGREVVRVRGRHAYIIYPDGIGRSRLTSALIERRLETGGVLRRAARRP